MINKASFLLLSALLICCGAEDTGKQGLEQEAEVHCLQTCPRYWFRYGTRCFKFVSEARSWAKSESHCVAMGGNLASVHSIVEHSFIQELIREHTQGTPRTWIGGYDAVEEGRWLWSDGSRFDYTDWSPGEPNNQYGGEHCIEINFGGRLLWNDLSCKRLLPSVCAVLSV
ncbi:ladderlectin-like isoform X2 [Clupea harengus]|uniref:Ladderlectin-like isoform X2 n=1 Tax=Clupea harengus TaxID=7950 RepID=A0A6P8EXV2_CLUHA|nr:ladderlectin-like isoform X2 [Clupea harengus]XP_031416907.1 ladderlectin-like isoform X2 [Clupea harengus]